MDKICFNCKHYHPDVGHGNEKLPHGMCCKPVVFIGSVIRVVRPKDSCKKFILEYKTI